MNINKTVTDITFSTDDFNAYCKVYEKKKKKVLKLMAKIKKGYLAVRAAKNKLENLKNGD